MSGRVFNISTFASDGNLQFKITSRWKSLCCFCLLIRKGSGFLLFKCLVATREWRWENRTSKALSLMDSVTVCQTLLCESLFQNVQSICNLPQELNPQLISFHTFQSERTFTSHKGETSASPFPPENDESPAEGLTRTSNYISVHRLLFSASRCYCAVYKPDRAWQPISQPGAGVPMGQHAAAPRPGPCRVPRPRHLPHKARFWSRRYARYCIFLDRGLCRLSADFCLNSQRGWLQLLPR